MEIYIVNDMTVMFKIIVWDGGARLIPVSIYFESVYCEAFSNYIYIHNN